MNKDLLRNIIAIMLIGIMVFVSDQFNSREIIFPEIGALVLGLWVIEKHVWRVKRWQITVLFTAASILGVCLVRYIPVALPFRLEIGFFLVAMLLMFLNSSMTPAISACMLPVLIGTESWIYPITVCLLSLVLVLVQYLLESQKVRVVPQTTMRFNIAPSRTKILLRWLALMLILVPIMIITIPNGWKLAMMPPLIVTLVEFSNSASGFRDRPFSIWITLILCAVIGTLTQSLLYLQFHLPQYLCAMISSAIILAGFHYTKRYFAPAMAIALVPMIIPANAVNLFPVYVAFGAAYFIFMAKICFAGVSRRKFKEVTHLK